MRRKINQNKLFIKITAIFFVLVLAVILFFGSAVQAQENDIQSGLQDTGEAAGLQTDDPRAIVGRIINIALGLLGSVAIIIVLYGGFLYMTAGGESEKVDKAKKVLINGFIGLTIILSSYAIVSFVINRLMGATEGGDGLETQYYASPILGSGYGLSNGAFGQVIQNHYPKPEQTEVARNTAIMVTFRSEIDPNSVIDSEAETDYPCPDSMTEGTICGPINTDSIRIYKCQDMINETQPDADLVDCHSAEITDISNEDLLVPGYVMVAADHRNVIFNPYGDSADQHLGNSDEEVPYIVYLKESIRKDDGSGDSIFNVKYNEYKWRFTTGTVIDLVPPKIISVIPPDVVYPDLQEKGLDENGYVYLNSLVVVNFDEPVIPLFGQSQSCTAEDENNEIEITGEEILPNCTTNHIQGDWQVGINGYRTVQFRPSTQCEGVDKNSCGQPVYCLPANSEITSLVKAAEVGETGIAQWFTGIMDMGQNSLDGNGNGEAEGRDADNYEWKFTTGESLELEPPKITSVEPANNSENIDIFQPIIATFDEALDSASVDEEVSLKGYAYNEEYAKWYDANLFYNNESETLEMQKIKLEHGPFAEWNPTEGEAPKYTPVITSKIKDLFQNCFNPSTEKNTLDNSHCYSSDLNDGDSCCPSGANNVLDKYSDTAVCPEPWE